MSNLAKLYNMAPSRLHAIYGGGSKILHKEDKDSIYPEEEESLEDKSSIYPEAMEDLSGSQSKLNTPMENLLDSPLFDGGDSKTDKEEELKIPPEESQILPNESKIPAENSSDSPLNEVDRLFANLTGGSQNDNSNKANKSSDYIYKLIEPEDLRLWLFDERLKASNDVSGGAETDDKSNTSAMRSSPYYSEFQALIDGLI